MSDGEKTIIPFHPLLLERRRVATDLANVVGAMRDLQLLVARQGITRDRAELIRAQCTDELKHLAGQLADLEKSLALLKGQTGRPRG
jgi:hypothetical protein